MERAKEFGLWDALVHLLLPTVRSAANFLVSTHATQ